MALNLKVVLAMKRLLVVIIVVLASMRGYSQEFNLFESRIEALYDAGRIPDSAMRATRTEEAWSALQSAHQIPLVVEDSVAFFYRGEARSVAWMGDFNGWGYYGKYPNKGTRIPGTNIWILRASFPRDTRLDYKILLNDNEWILDPENPHQQWSGLGGGSPNSQLQMPEWTEDPILQPRPNIPHGKLEEDILLASKVLGYQVMLSVYVPPNPPAEKMPSLYVTDGYEYLLPRLGNMTTILDNLIADQKIKPLIVVFVDHREPINRANNKRMDELAMNPKYLEFFETELIPFVEKHYPVIPNFEKRGILGTSMGGLTAAYFAFSKPGVFGMAGIQSPAFKIKPQIYAICDNPNHPLKVSMTSGTLSDASEASHKMRDIFQTNACEYHYREVNDGHSWGNWRNLIDDILIDLYGN